MLVSKETFLFYAADHSVWSNLEEGLGTTKDISDRYDSIQNKSRGFPGEKPDSWTQEEYMWYILYTRDVAVWRGYRCYTYIDLFFFNWYARTAVWSIVWTCNIYLTMDFLSRFDKSFPQ